MELRESILEREGGGVRKKRERGNRQRKAGKESSSEKRADGALGRGRHRQRASDSATEFAKPVEVFRMKEDRKRGKEEQGVTLMT